MLVEVITDLNGFRVRSKVDGQPEVQTPVHDYQLACAYAQGIAAGYNLTGRLPKARVVYCSHHDCSLPLTVIH